MDSIRDGAIDFIVKPFERERVLALLAKLENAAAPRTSA
jgi:FixJ family two-component response regulator